MTFQVAVSYAHHDVAEVVTDIEALSNGDTSYWMDRSLTGGVVWREEIAQQFEQANAVIAFLSPSWLASDYCRQEISFALDKGKPILCLCLEEVQLTPGLQMSLNHRQTIYRYQFNDDLQAYYNRINAAIAILRKAVNPGYPYHSPTQATTRMSPKALHLVHNNRQYSVASKREDHFRIGRSSECELVLRSDFVSRVHGYLYTESGSYYYKDTSSNGTELISHNQDTKLTQQTALLDSSGQLIIGGAIINFYTDL